MRTYKKYGLLMLSIVIVLMSALLTACNDGGTKVSLYDGDTYLREVSVSIGSGYDFGEATKTGYRFLGWYSAKEGGSAYTDAQGKSAGLTWKEDNAKSVYAHWDADTYKITFDYCGATALNTVTDISVVYDEEVTAAMPVPQKSGYSFLGWFTAKTNGTQITDASGNLVSNAKLYNDSVYPLQGEGTVLYAQWGEKTVTFAFNSDGSAVEQITCSVGTVLYELPVSVKDNYCFESWCFDSATLSEIRFPYTITDSLDDFVNLYAKFEIGSNDILQFTTIPSTKDKEYEVTYTGNDEKIVIPDSYYGKRVTKIGKVNSTTVKVIVLPQTIKVFSNATFENCTALERVNIPMTIEDLPESIFAGCVSLSNVYIPQKVKTIGKLAFSGCAAITEIKLSSNITAIGIGAFRNIAGLESITVDKANAKYKDVDGVLYYLIGNSTYLIQYPAAKVGDTFKIEENTTKISEYAFSGSKIKSIEIGNRVSSIDAGAFEDCKNLISVAISGNAALFTIGADAFLNCANLKAMKIELSKAPTLNATALNGVSETFSVYVTSDMIKRYQSENGWRNIATKIYSLGTIYGDFAVEEVDGGYAIRQYFGTNKEVIVPEILNAQKIVMISENAFSFSDIEKVTISKNVKKIGNRAFANCSLLKTIVVECEPPELGEAVFDGIDAEYGIYVKNTVEVLNSYRTANKWAEMSAHIWSYNNQ